MKLYCLQCKQYQLVDSMLFGQVRLAVFSGAVEIFYRKGWLSKLAPLEKMGPDARPMFFQRGLSNKQLLPGPQKDSLHSLHG